jgi:hypothetical protein
MIRFPFSVLSVAYRKAINFQFRKSLGNMLAPFYGSGEKTTIHRLNIYTRFIIRDEMCIIWEMVIDGSIGSLLLNVWLNQESRVAFYRDPIISSLSGKESEQLN